MPSVAPIFARAGRPARPLRDCDQALSTWFRLPFSARLTPQVRSPFLPGSRSPVACHCASTSRYRYRERAAAFLMFSRSLGAKVASPRLGCLSGGDSLTSALVR